MNSLQSTALALSTRFSVFPLQANGKKPSTLHGQNDATQDSRIIKSWWLNNPSANIGIACEPSGLYVIDIDCGPGKNGQESWDKLVAKHDHVPTYTVRTPSGGLHYYYASDEGLKNTASSIGEHIDTRGNGYVVGPGSVINGVTYEVIEDIPIAPLPQWIANAVYTKEKVRVSAAVVPAQRTIAKDDEFDGEPAGRWVTKTRVDVLVSELRKAPLGKGNVEAARISFMVGQYVGAGQISLEDAEKALTKAVSHWTWVAPQDKAVMLGTISRSLQAGAGVPKSWKIPNRTKGEEKHRGQLRMAHRMAHGFSDELRNIHGLGWHVWDGSRWSKTLSGEPTRYANATLDQAIEDLKELRGSTADDLWKDVKSCQSNTGLQGMVKLAGDLLPLATAAKDVDGHPTLINLPGGTLDLDTVQIRPHERDDLITKVTNADPGIAGQKVWDDFILRILPDKDVRDFVQRLLGQSLLGQVLDQHLPIFTGTGANGKGTLKDAVMYALGEYAVEIDPRILMAAKYEQHPTEMMEFKGRRLMFSSETERGHRLAEAKMKRLTGGDHIQGRYMGKDYVSFKPSHTLILLTNHLPEVSGDDAAIWRRVLVVPFDVVIPEAERDPSLPHRLELAAPAVMAWLVEGYREYLKWGLKPPDAVRLRTDAYRKDSDVLGRFIAEECLVGPGYTGKASILYDRYTRWADNEGLRKDQVMSSVIFARSLAERGYTKKRHKTQGQIYSGIGVLVED